MKDAEQRVQRALDIIFRDGGVDGAHHKQRCLDEVVQALTGDEQGYAAWVAAYCDGEDGPDTYEWEKGC